jgi:Flp pilus assembly protein TadG
MRLTRERGQSMAEFALVLPVFLLIVMGLFDVGRAVFIYNGLTNAVREGARLAIVNQDKALIAQRAQQMAFGTAITTAPANLTRFYRALPNSDDVTANAVCNPVAVGCVAVVAGDAQVTAITPIIGNFLGPITLHARSELEVELVCPNAAFTSYATSDLCPRQP